MAEPAIDAERDAERDLGDSRLDVKLMSPEVRQAIVDYAAVSDVPVAVIIARLWRLREYHREGARHRLLEQHGLGQRIL